MVETLEESEHARVLLWWRAILTGVTLGAEDATDGEGSGHGCTRNHTQDLKLSVAEEPKVAGEVDVAKEVTNNVANTSHARSPCVGIVLLMGRSLIDNESADGSLDDIDTEVQDIDHQHSECDRRDTSSLAISCNAEELKKSSNQFPSPSQSHERNDGGSGTSNHERTTLAEARTASVRFGADIRLDQCS